MTVQHEGRHSLHKQSQPGRWQVWLVSAAGLAVLAAVVALAVPALGTPTESTVRLTGPVGVVPATSAPAATAPTASPTTSPPVPAPPLTVEVAPATVQVHVGRVVEDCTLSDPLIPAYVCPGR